MRARSIDKGHVDLQKLELDRHAHLEEALRGDVYDGRGNLSVSMPLSEINDYKYACVLKGIPYRVEIREHCKKVVGEVDEIALANAERQAEYFEGVVKMLRERVEKEGSLIQRVIDKYVNEGVSGIETIQTRGRYSKIVENENQVGFREVCQIWDKIPIEFRDPAHPDDVQRCMKALEDRLARVKNKTVRMSAIDQLERMKHTYLGEIYGQGQEDLDEKTGSIEELMMSERAKRGMVGGAAIER